MSLHLDPEAFINHMDSGAKEKVQNRRNTPEYLTSLENLGFSLTECIFENFDIEDINKIFDAIKLACKRSVAASEASFALKFAYSTEFYDEDSIIKPEYDVDDNDHDEWEEPEAYEADPSEFKIEIAIADQDHENIILEDGQTKRSFLTGVAKFFMEMLNASLDNDTKWQFDPTDSSILYIIWDYPTST